MSRITKRQLHNRRRGPHLNMIPMNNKPTNENFNLKEFLMIDACFKLGIAPPPPFDPDKATDLQKKKFRKLWRKLDPDLSSKKYKLDPKFPAPRWLRARRIRVVYTWVEKKFVTPFIQEIEEKMNSQKNIQE